MRLLVTGAGGFVGRGLLASLAAHGHEGWATGREPPSDLPQGWRAARRMDVLTGAVEATDVEAVVHLEVKHHVQRPSPKDLRDFHEVNVRGTRRWLDWADRSRVDRFVFVSSIKAAAPGDASEEVLAVETTASGRRRPESAYGMSKAAAERAVRAWVCDHDRRRGVILRPAPVYGPGSDANLAAFFRAVIAGRPCLIGAGDAVKSVVSRVNLVAAIEFGLGMRNRSARCEVFNVADTDAVTLRQLAEMIAVLADAPRPRSMPRWTAGLVARFGDAVSLVTRRDFPLTTRRMAEMLAASHFPSTKLEAAGFRHPQSTREGLVEWLEWFGGRAG